MRFFMMIKATIFTELLKDKHNSVIEMSDLSKLPNLKEKNITNNVSKYN